MSKVTKYLLKRIADLEAELFSVKNQNAILEDEIIGLESENKNLNWSVEEGEKIIFSKERLISTLQQKVEELSPKPEPKTFGDLDAFKSLKAQLLKEEEEWKKKKENEDN